MASARRVRSRRRHRRSRGGLPVTYRTVLESSRLLRRTDDGTGSNVSNASAKHLERRALAREIYERGMTGFCTRQAVTSRPTTRALHPFEYNDVRRERHLVVSSAREIEGFQHQIAVRSLREGGAIPSHACTGHTFGSAACTTRERTLGPQLFIGEHEEDADASPGSCRAHFVPTVSRFMTHVCNIQVF